MQESYILNGKDLYTTFGMIISGGSDTFLAFPKRKESLTHSWPEEQGVDIDLSEPNFEAREFKLSCALVCAGRTEFWLKYNGLFTELGNQGIHQLYIKDLDKTFLIYYKSQENIGKLTQLDRNRVAIKFDLIFGETNPADNIEVVYLVDDEDRFLIA